MVTFYGKYTSKLDDKGRHVLPAPLKAELPEGGDMRFVVRKDIFETAWRCTPMGSGNGRPPKSGPD